MQKKEVNTKLCKHDKWDNVLNFGDTGFYVQIYKYKYNIIDETNGLPVFIATYPKTYKIDVIQDLFDFYYAGYCRGEEKGKSYGRKELRDEFRRLLDIGY